MGCSLLVLREGLESVVTEGEMKDELLVCREGWEVVVSVNTTD